MHYFTAMLLDDHLIVRQGFKALGKNIPGLSIIGDYGRSRDLIAAMEIEQPKILFLDFTLHPDDVDGHTLIRSIKRRFPSVRIIVLSAHARRSVAALAMSAGADGFCSKDVSVDELVTATQRVLAGRKHYPDRYRATGNIDYDSVFLTHSVHSSPLNKLTPREREVINLFLMGLSISEISRKLSRDRKTVSGHKQSAYRKLGISSDAEIFSIRHMLE